MNLSDWECGNVLWQACHTIRILCHTVSHIHTRTYLHACMSPPADWSLADWLLCGLLLYRQQLQHINFISSYRYADMMHGTDWMILSAEEILSRCKSLHPVVVLVLPGGAEEPPEGYYEDDVDALKAEAAAARCSDTTSESDSDSQSGSVAGDSPADVQPWRRLHLTGSARPDTHQVDTSGRIRAISVSIGRSPINKVKHSCGSDGLLVKLFSRVPPKAHASC